MSQEPFLLDPRYHGTLDSDAFRRRYLELNRRRWWSSCAVFGVPVPFLIPSLVFFIMGLVRRRADDFDMCAWLLLIPALPFALALIGFALHVRERAFHRRMARHGARVAGTIVTCLRKYYPHDTDTSEGPATFADMIPGLESDDEDDSSSAGDVLEVVYAARAPSGAELRGVKARRRNDL